MEQSPLDDREYRRLTLPNELRVLLVSDQVADRAAACLSVGVGSRADPDDLPGLAHFCEHMAFLGTAKYPDEASYRAFIKAHGGWHNASTGAESTDYYFSVMVDKAERAAGGEGDSGGASRAEDDATQGCDANGAPAKSVSAECAPAKCAPSAAARDGPTPSLEGSTKARDAAPAAGCAPSPPIPPGLAPYLEALDRFAQFFIAPLFTPSATSREVQAVEGEFKSGLLHDGNRRCQVLRQAVAPGHPARKWGVGNAASLWDKPTAAGVDVRAALLAFHKRHYSANRMTLVLVAPAPLDTLAVWAEALFDAIPNTRAPVASDAYAGWPPFGPAETGRRLHVVPIEEHRWLSLFWVVPPFGATYLTDPAGYIAYRFNYGGPGSLLSALRARGWASSVSASSFECASHWQTVQVFVDLTRAGAEAATLDAVIQSILAYLRLLEKEGVTPRSYQDAADIARNFWTYRSREEPAPLAESLARRLHYLPDEHLLTGESLYAQYDEPLILDTLRLLTPAAAVVMVVDPAFEGSTDLVEERYGTAYSISRIPEATLAAWAAAEPWPELAVGPPNAFIPTDLSLVCDALDGTADDGGQPARKGLTAVPTRVAEPTVLPGVPSPLFVVDCNGDADAASGEVGGDPSLAPAPQTEGAEATPVNPPVWESPLLPPVVPLADAPLSTHPVVLRDDASVRLHYKLDRTFRRPKAYVCVRLHTPAVHRSARSWVLADLATLVLADSLTEETADAADAGLFVGVAPTTDGLSLSLSGYTHKLPLLLAVAVERLARFQADPARFARVYEVLQRDYKNSLKQDPLDHASSTVSMLTATPMWHLLDLINVFGEDSGKSSPRPALGARGGEKGVMASEPLPPSPAEVEAFVASLWPGGVFIEALITGNVSPEGALAMVATIQAALPSPPLPTLEVPARRVVQLPIRQTVVARIASPNPLDPNSAVQVVYQLGLGGDPAVDVALGLLSSMLSDRVFTVLRTEQQLGYDVSAWCYCSAGVNGLCVAVQSPSASPETVAARIQACLDDFGAVTLPAMDAAPFKVALRAALREPDKHLWGQTSRYLGEVFNHTYDYGRREAQAVALDGVDTAALCRLWATYLAADAPQRRMLVSAVHPPAHPPALSPAEERAAGGGGAVPGGTAGTAVAVAVAPPVAAAALPSERKSPATGWQYIVIKANTC
ncbi:hypothetical protein I4F81_012589 [Pyropia yezoensis]|uniref:Uncharacterized protein n=1 Tax=Pyropia yezoensis TaxID=2788 RepID=A0ACC3CIX9_PYRYE|nr:hypothetical protein I4F81_012589 [Neopyropia yezoensis]